MNNVTLTLEPVVDMEPFSHDRRAKCGTNSNLSMYPILIVGLGGDSPEFGQNTASATGAEQITFYEGLKSHC